MHEERDLPTHQKPHGHAGFQADTKVLAFVEPEFFSFLNEHNHTPSGKKTVTRVPVIDNYIQVQSIGCRWQAISSCHNRVKQIHYRHTLPGDEQGRKH